MFTPERFRVKAAECGELAKTAIGQDDAHEFRQREKSLTMLADNEQWLADHYEQTVRTAKADGANTGISLATETALGVEELGTEEEHILRCLGAALIMQWNTLPKKLQRELFDTAGSMGALLETASLRGQIARYLHWHQHGVAEIVGGDTTRAAELSPAHEVRSEVVAR